jgi:hypothetical protein
MRAGSTPAAGLVLLILSASGAPSIAQPLGPGARPFSSCQRIPNAVRLDALRRPGIGAVLCRIGPELRFAVLSDDTVSWPVILGGGGSAVSLEDPLAKRAWLPNATPVRMRPGRERFRVVPGAGGAAVALVYSGFVSRTDGPGSVNVFVALRLRPQACLLGVTRDSAAALRLTRDASAPCISPFGRG